MTQMRCRATLLGGTSKQATSGRHGTYLIFASVAAAFSLERAASTTCMASGGGGLREARCEAASWVGLEQAIRAVTQGRRGML